MSTCLWDNDSVIGNSVKEVQEMCMRSKLTHQWQQRIYILIQVYVFQATDESCQGLFGMYHHYPQFPTQQNKTLEKII